jgi:hypothetical protein
VVANGNPPKGASQCNRKQTAAFKVLPPKVEYRDPVFKPSDQNLERGKGETVG